MGIKKQPLLPLEKIFDLDYIKFMLTVSASSCRFGKIILHETDGKLVAIRGTTNCLVIGPFGIGKSSTIFKISNVKVEKANNVSSPGLIGTISKDGQPIIGSCFRAGGKVLIIDEAEQINKDTKSAMNAILEYPHEHTKTLGFKVNQYLKQKGYNAMVEAKDNEMYVTSKFSCIASTTRVSLKRTVDKAWFSRFIPIRLRVDIDYMERFLGGGTIYEISALDFKGDFDFPDYMKFKQYYFDNIRKSMWISVLENKKDWYGVLARNIGDIIRIGAYTAAMDNGRTVITFEDCKKIFDKFFDQMMYNILIGPLNPNEYEALVSVDVPQRELAERLNISEAAVSKIYDDLRTKGLIKVIDDKNNKKY